MDRVAALRFGLILGQRFTSAVIPAKAGIHAELTPRLRCVLMELSMGPGLRRGDSGVGVNSVV